MIKRAKFPCCFTPTSPSSEHRVGRPPLSFLHLLVLLSDARLQSEVRLSERSQRWGRKPSELPLLDDRVLRGSRPPHNTKKKSGSSGGDQREGLRRHRERREGKSCLRLSFLLSTFAPEQHSPKLSSPQHFRIPTRTSPGRPYPRRPPATSATAGLLGSPVGFVRRVGKERPVVSKLFPSWWFLFSLLLIIVRGGSVETKACYGRTMRLNRKACFDAILPWGTSSL